MKICACCGIEKSIERFSKNVTEKDGLYRYCKDCVREKTKKYRSAHKDEINARKKISYHKSKAWADKRTQIQAELGHKVCSDCGADKPISDYYKRGNGGFYSYCKSCANRKSKEYQEKNRDAILKRKRAYHEEHKEEHLEKMHEYYLTHADAVKANVRKWALDHPEEMKMTAAISSSRKRSLERGLETEYTKEEWKSCRKSFTVDGQVTCAYCGKPIKRITQDHVIPISKGGGYTIDNIVPACQSCNSSKSNKDFEEWYRTRPFYSEERKERICTYIANARQYREGRLSIGLCNA